MDKQELNLRGGEGSIPDRATCAKARSAEVLEGLRSWKQAYTAVAQSYRGQAQDKAGEVG